MSTIAQGVSDYDMLVVLGTCLGCASTWMQVVVGQGQVNVGMVSVTAQN
jgi:hypothetical protein